jgi:DUF2075 family protein
LILYSSSALAFRDDVEDNSITEKIENAFFRKFGYLPGSAERNSWTNSMHFMETIVRKSKVADDCGVLIEFNIPNTNKRIDFLMTGKAEDNSNNFIVIELKQWSEAKETTRRDVVVTFIGQGEHEVAHPSYQALSYLDFLVDMNSAIQEGDLKGSACAYLHNYKPSKNEPLLLPQYRATVDEAPIFFETDASKLQTFLATKVGKGKGIEILYLIENGKIRPTKMLVDCVAGLFKGNDEFTLLDDQKVAFERIMEACGQTAKKIVIVVKGGPGSGKSVIALNVFGKLIQKGLDARFVAPNAAFRTVMLETLVKNDVRQASRIQGLFKGSGSFWDSGKDQYDVLIVDEAHRLKDGSAYMYKGDNQVDDVIRSSRVTILFIDDQQQIRAQDIGSRQEIARISKNYDAQVVELALEAQFRCAGAQGFINWIEDCLQLQSTGNALEWDISSFDFQIFDSPNLVHEKIREKQNEGRKARMLAGFAWKWTPEGEGNNHGEIEDVSIPEHGFSMPWNQRSGSTLWAVSPEGKGQIGCVHTAQGLEFDYIGLIIGNDMKFNPGTGKVYADWDEYKDKAGRKGLVKNSDKFNLLVKNIYRILLSRGMKGCYLFCRDSRLQEYFKARFRAVLGTTYQDEEATIAWDVAESSQMR